MGEKFSNEVVAQQYYAVSTEIFFFFVAEYIVVGTDCGYPTGIF
jgi:hypothetical protein